MSAITGIYQFNKNPVKLQHGRLLMKFLEKFPSDSRQIWNDDKVFLGSHAQWITPESVQETLPFYDYERQMVITADAIIDNRQELFDLLTIEKSDRSSLTDSQLILLSYQKWGEDCLKRLVGEFAFMIWDQRQQRLFGARDFSGSRTLYFHKNQESLAFCTVIEPLLALPYIEKKLNEQWLAEYLAISGMVDGVDSSITPYQTIEQVPPSHSISIVNNKVMLKRYSYITQGKILKLKSDGEYVEAFQSVFQEAVTSRLRTHRKVGSQLSGGLDSGAVVGFAAKNLRRENKLLHTFSYVPPDDFKDFTPKYLVADERTYIKSTVEYVGGISDNYYDFNGKDSHSEIDDLLGIMEMPYKFFENSFWLKGMFEKAQEQDIGILLNGDRGNFTISWGGAFDYYATLLKKLKWLRLFKELDQFRKNAGVARLGSLPTIARIGFPIIDRAFPEGNPYTIPSLINPEFAKKMGVYAKFNEYGIDQNGWYPNSDIYTERKKHFEDVFQWNTSGTLAAKLSLRYSVLKRDPTNDIRLIRFCLSVPENQYVQNGVDRALVRRGTENYLPDKVRLNQRFFGVQGADWVHRMIPKWDIFKEELHELSRDKRVLEYLDAQALKVALLKVKQEPMPEYATDSDYKFLMRSLIVYRFLKQFN